jgi:hypothetical protein
MDPIVVKSIVKDYLPWVLFGVSVLIGIGVGGLARDKLWRKMGMPSWDFTSSWATNITVTGWFVSLPLVATIGSSSAQDPIFHRFNYVVMNMMFLLLAAAAPLVYNLSRTVTIETPENGTPSLLRVGV